ncbi:MAG: LacI family DNA-binding transcriptional regulator [Actinomycetota bacterium]|nr:LacI family DNA-binding transcriptional regulator [Actinomycetota bacterium]
MTSADVARVAGVSRTTVSFVLNDTKNQSIAPATRRAVFDAAEELGYTPSPEARALRSGRSGIVLGILPDWPIGGAFGMFLSNLTHELSSKGMTFLTHQIQDADADLASVWGALTPDIVLAMGDLTSSDVSALRARGVGIVRWLGSVEGYPDSAVISQHEVGVTQARILLDQGHKRLAYVQPAESYYQWFSDRRLAGVAAECAAARVPRPRVMVGDFKADSLEESLSALLHGPSAVTGICAYNDEVALLLLTTMRRLNLVAPTDVSVVGVDNSELGAAWEPALSTVEFALTDEAEHVANQIRRVASGRPLGRSKKTDAIIAIVRDSTGAPRN